ncbi:Putative UDP-glucuronosyltransferase ugt-55 [Toxocara canis]|uniref:glucuronosyltransferase n=1 Tax=Toxocara canis TaxID=6265 RepID=A0A0B2W5K8_TOXCA|nr:Putative UDP-glucuronosyltransferase ugt-55 [Toxocara canis]
MSSALILNVIVLLSSCCEGHKILVYSPKLFWSHVGFMGRIADILVGAGHDVGPLTFVPFVRASASFNEENMVVERAIGKKMGRGLLGDAELMRRLRNEKFDLGISEAFSSCGFGIFEKIRLHKYLIASNTELMEALTEPFGISYNPAMSQTFLPLQMTWALSSKENLICRGLLGDVELMRRLRDEKFDLGISEAFSFCGFGIFEKIGLHKYLIASNAELMEALTEPFGISYNPAMSQETMARCPSVFVNTNILLDFPREVNSKVVFVGGITASQSSSLSEVSCILRKTLLLSPSVSP